MGYDSSYHHGRAEYNSWMQISDSEVQELTGIEGNENLPLEQRKYAQLVYSVNAEAGGASGVLTNAQLRATPLDVNLVSSSLSGLTNAQLRAAPLSSILVSDDTLVSQNNPLPVLISSVSNRIRDGFDIINTDLWDVVSFSGDLVETAGNTAGAGYVKISKCPRVSDTETYLQSKFTLNYPTRVTLGSSLSQRVGHQHFGIEFIGVDASGNVENMVDNYTPVSASLSQSTTTLTVTTLGSHNLIPGDVIDIYGCDDSRANYCAMIVATVVNSAQFTSTSTIIGTITTNTITGSGYIVKNDPVANAANAFSLVLDAVTTANAKTVVRSNSGSFKASASTSFGTTHSNGTQGNTGNYCDSWSPAFYYDFRLRSDNIIARTFPIDNITTQGGTLKTSQIVPNSDKQYKIRLRAKTNKSASKIAASIYSISKSGSTTWTVTTTANHNLVTGNYVAIYGCRDTTNFANITTPVACIVTGPTTFTCLGTTGTASAYGGVVVLVNGQTFTNATPATPVVQSISRIGNQLEVIFSATMATALLVGETANLLGLVGTAGEDYSAYEGVYKVAYVATTTVRFYAPGADLAIVNCSGAAIKRTDWRLHFLRLFDYTRSVVDIDSGSGDATDIQMSVPTSITNIPACNISQYGGTSVVTGGVAGITAVGGNIAVGTAPTANPVLAGSLDIAGLTKTVRSGWAGELMGPGEVVYSGCIFTAGSTTPVEGTNSRTYVALPGRDCELQVGILTQGNAANTMQIEGSHDNRIYSVIPMSRIDVFLNTNNYGYLSGWTPVSNTVLKGRTYGYPFVRVHQTALTTLGTSLNVLRLTPLPQNPGEIVSPFTITDQTTNEASGTLSGAIQSGGMRTLYNTCKGSAKAILDIDAFTFSGIPPTSSSFILEGISGSNPWVTLPLTPYQGGSQVTTISGVGVYLSGWFGGRWEANVSNLDAVRARWAGYSATSGTIIPRYHGALRIVPIPNINDDIPLQISSPGFEVSAAFTRSNDTSAYDALDVMGTNPATNLTFSGVGNIPGTHVIIAGASMALEASATLSGMTGMRLHMYNQAPSAILDNSAFNLLAADRSKYLGYIEIPTLEDLGDNLWRRVDNVNMKIKLAPGSTSLYGVLQTTTAFVPSAQLVSDITLMGYQC